MILGMTRGELGLTVFIFALVYSAGWLPKVASGLARMLGQDKG
jgi:hypothetical protein